MLYQYKTSLLVHLHIPIFGCFVLRQFQILNALPWCLPYDAMQSNFPTMHFDWLSFKCQKRTKATKEALFVTTLSFKISSLVCFKLPENLLRLGRPHLILSRPDLIVFTWKLSRLGWPDFFVLTDYFWLNLNPSIQEAHRSSIQFGNPIKLHQPFLFRPM